MTFSFLIPSGRVIVACNSSRLGRVLGELTRCFPKWRGEDCEHVLRYKLAVTQKAHNINSYSISRNGREIYWTEDPSRLWWFWESLLHQDAVGLAGDSHWVIHSASVAWGDRACLLAGNAESGKSTTTAALLKRGYTYLSDDLSFVVSGCRKISPFPRAINIRSGMTELLGPLQPEITMRGFPFWDSSGQKHMAYCGLPCRRLLPKAGSQFSIEAVFFIGRASGRACKPIRLSKALTAFRLLRLCVNRQNRTSQCLEAMMGLCEKVPGFELDVGNLPEACHRIDCFMQERATP